MSKRQGLRNNSPSKASLLEQIRLLTIENETLLKFIADRGFTEGLQPKLPNGKDDAGDKRTRRRSASSNVKNKTANVPPTPGTPIAGKGCSCKGNCSTRVCGCVKKNIPCAEFCRCGDELCQNTEPDKENIGDPNQQSQLSKEGEESLKKLSSLTLDDNNTKKKPNGISPVNKHLQKVVKARSLFSPEVRDDVFNFDNAGGEEAFENVSLRFGDDPEEEMAQPAEKEHKAADVNKDEPAKKSKKKVEKTKVKINLRLNEASEDEEAEDHVEPEPTKKIKKKAEKKEKGSAETSKQVRRAGSGETDESIGDEYSVAETAKKEKKKVESKKKATTRTKNNRKGSDEADEEIFEENEQTEPKPVESNNKAAARKQHNRIASDETSEDASPEEEEQPESPTVNTDEQQIETKINYEKNDDVEVNKSRGNSSHSDLSSPESKASSQVSGADNMLGVEESDVFNPMKPRRQLPRSPLRVPVEQKTENQEENQTQEHLSPRAVKDPSEILLPVPLKEEPEDEPIPPPKELEKVVVDWDEHQANLVQCHKCKRTFHPHRIKKHEAFCKKI